MFKMKKILLFLSVLLCCACSDNDEPTPEAEAPMTVLAYFVADNDLNEELLVNINTMFQGLSNFTNSATLYIYWDGRTSIQEHSDPVVVRYSTDGNGKINGIKAKGKSFTSEEILDIADIIKEYPDQVSTQKGIMTKVLKDMVDMVPAKSLIGLVAGSHASSWLKNHSNGRAFGYDGTSYIENADMAEAMIATGRKFDFLLFDACLMGAAEVCYDFKDAANYIIASVLEIPADGFPYDLMLNNLYEANIDGYKKACQSYLDFYRTRVKNGVYNSWGTISLYDNQRIDDFASVVKEQIVGHKESLKNFDATVLPEYGRDSYPYVSVDAVQFIKTLNDGIIPESFGASLNSVVLYTGCLSEANPNRYSVEEDNYCGLGIYVPIKGKLEWNTFFKTIDWYTAAGWNEISFDWYF